MAEQVTIPAGVDVSRAVPADAQVYQRSGQPGGLPVLPSGATQEPGFTPPTPASADKDYAAFKAWQAAQAAPVVPTPAATVVPPAAPAKTAGFEGMGGDAAYAATKQAAQNDPHLMSVFSMFELVAPDVDLARAVGTALDRGDATLIDVKYLMEKGGDKAAKLVEVAKGLVSHVTAQVEALTAGVYAKAGGETQWAAQTAVFNDKAPKYLKEFVAASFDSANPQRISAAAEAVLEFVKGTGAVPVAPQGHVRAGGGAPNAALGLSKAEYQSERLKLDRRARDFPDRERELNARRAIGKAAGK